MRLPRIRLPKIAGWNKELVVAVAVAAAIAIAFILVQTDRSGRVNEAARIESKDECDRWNDDAVETMTKAIALRKADTTSEELTDELQAMNTSRPEGCEDSDRLLELHEEYKEVMGF